MKKAAPAQAPTPVSSARFLLSAEDLAGLLRVSVKTVRNMDAAGQLPPALTISAKLKRWHAGEIHAFFRASYDAGRPIRRPEWLTIRGGLQW